MVRKFDSQFRPKYKTRIKADVIILGCSLPGIVTAHQLKKRFGNTMDIIVLDLSTSSKNVSKCNVAFQETMGEDDETQSDDSDEYDRTARQLIDNVAKYYLSKYAKDLNIPLPDAIINPERDKSKLNKLFQHRNGKTVECVTDYHDFDYLCFMEKFELNQYQSLLDRNMKELFQTSRVRPDEDRNKLLYYDHTTMEEHINSALLFSTSREIMRTTVRLVCGVPASSVSVLFYLHQCYRISSSRNHLDGDNTRLREKLLGYCRKRLASKLQQSVADITTAVSHIQKIRTSANEQVVLEPLKGETTYACTLLALALKPDELHTIRLEDRLMSEKDTEVTRSMIPGRAKKFVVQYDDAFWNKQGYSGDILSIRGPVIWAMERPKMSTTGSIDRYAALIGYLVVRDSDEVDSKSEVIEQLVKLFGEEAASPVTYRETSIADIFVPQCGDFITLTRMISQDSPKFLEWASLDIFAEGDVASAIEAGHTAYLHLLSCLRPQAQTFEDLSSGELPTLLTTNPLRRLLANVNLLNGMRWSVYIGVSVMALRLLKSIIQK